MRVTAFNHLAIKALDFEASLAFYRDILGLEPLETVETDEGRFTNLLIPGGAIIELIQPPKTGKSPDSRSGTLVDHIALDVDDVADAEERLRERGVDILLPCTESEIFNTRVVKCKDPNGIIVSLRKDLR